MEGTIKYCLLIFLFKLSNSAGKCKSCLISKTLLKLSESTTEEFWPGKDCPVDPDIGLDDPNNVFSCKPDEECCTKNLKPACCAAMPTDMMIQDQIELWVPLAVIITILGLFVWFCRSDQSLLDAETPCLQKFCCCLGYKKRGDDGHLHIISEDLGSSTSLKSQKSAVVTIEDDEEVYEFMLVSYFYTNTFRRLQSKTMLLILKLFLNLRAMMSPRRTLQRTRRMSQMTQ